MMRRSNLALLVSALVWILANVALAKKSTCSLTINGKTTDYDGCSELSTIPQSLFGTVVPTIYYKVDGSENVTIGLYFDASKYVFNFKMTFCAFAFKASMTDAVAMVLYDALGDEFGFIAREWDLNPAVASKTMKGYPTLNETVLKTPQVGYELSDYEKTEKFWSIQYTMPANSPVIQEGFNPVIWAINTEPVTVLNQLNWHALYGTGSLEMKGLGNSASGSGNSSRPTKTPGPTPVGSPAPSQCTLTFNGQNKPYQGCQTVSVGVEVFWANNGTDRINLAMKAKADGFAGVAFGANMVGSHAAMIYQLMDGTIDAGDFYLEGQVAADIKLADKQGLNFWTIERTPDGEFVVEFSRPLKVPGLPSVVDGENSIIWAVSSSSSKDIKSFAPHAVNQRGIATIVVDKTLPPITSSSSPTASATTPAPVPATKTPTPSPLPTPSPTAPVPVPATKTPTPSPLKGSPTPIPTAGAQSPTPSQTPTTLGSNCTLTYLGFVSLYNSCWTLAPDFNIFISPNGTDRVNFGIKARTEGYATIGFGNRMEGSDVITVYNLQDGTYGVADLAIDATNSSKVTLAGAQQLKIQRLVRTPEGDLILEASRPRQAGPGAPVVREGANDLVWSWSDLPVEEITQLNPAGVMTRGATSIVVPTSTMGPVTSTPPTPTGGATYTPSSESPSTSYLSPTPSCGTSQTPHGEASPTQSHGSSFPSTGPGSTTPTHEALPTPTIEASPTPAHLASHSPAIQVTPTPVYFASPTPAFGTSQTPASGATPTQEYKVSATPTFQASPTPANQVSVTPVYHASPTPANPASVTPVYHTSPTPANQASATPAYHASPTQANQVSPTPPYQASATPVYLASPSAVYHASPTPTPTIAYGETSTAELSQEPSEETVAPQPTVLIAVPSSVFACFPADATVELESGETVSMEFLALGDRVRTSSGSFSEVFFMTHRVLPSESSRLHQFVRISGDSSQVELSPSHYIYANGKLVAAGDVQVDDWISLVSQDSERPEKVQRVEHVLKAGLFNPHTLDGDLVVNSVQVSCYTTAVHPRIAHALLFPLRALRLMLAGAINRLAQMFYGDLPRLASLVPSGPKSL